MSLFLLAISCGTPKKNIKKNEDTKKEVPTTETEVKEVNNQLIGVLNNPKSIDDVKALVKNSGLKWKSMLMDEGNSKIAVIGIPDGKYDFWIERLNNSGEFKTVTRNSSSLAKELINREKNTLVSLRKTQCFGDCPTYELYIDKEGNVTYVGKQFVIEKGTKDFKLSEGEFKTLQNKLNAKEFTSFKDTYDNPRLMDLQSTYITYAGKQVKIRLWNDTVPDELINLHEYLEGLLLEKKFFE